MPTGPTEIEVQVRAKASELGVDPDLASFVAFQESTFNPKAVSKKGAQGVMQVMPETAKELAPRYGNDNIAQGIGYLKDQLDSFADLPHDQQHYFALASYNWGPARVLSAMEKAKGAGRDPFNIASIADYMPEETANYVANIGDRVRQNWQRLEGEKANAPRGMELQPQPEVRTMGPRSDPNAMDIIEQPGATVASTAPGQTMGRRAANAGMRLVNRGLDILTPPAEANVSPMGTFARTGEAQQQSIKAVGRRLTSAIKGLGEYGSEVLSQGILDTPVARHLEAIGNVAVAAGLPLEATTGASIEALYRQTAEKPTERGAQLANMAGQLLGTTSLTKAAPAIGRRIGKVTPAAEATTEAGIPIYKYSKPTVSQDIGAIPEEMAGGAASAFSPRFGPTATGTTIGSTAPVAAEAATTLTPAAVPMTGKSLKIFSTAMETTLGAYLGHKATGSTEGGLVGAMLGHPVRRAATGAISLGGNTAKQLFNIFRYNPITLPILAQLLATSPEDPQYQALSQQLVEHIPQEEAARKLR